MYGGNTTKIIKAIWQLWLGKGLARVCLSGFTSAMERERCETCKHFSLSSILFLAGLLFTNT